MSRNIVQMSYVNLQLAASSTSLVAKNTLPLNTADFGGTLNPGGYLASGANYYLNDGTVRPIMATGNGPVTVTTSSQNELAVAGWLTAANPSTQAIGTFAIPAVSNSSTQSLLTVGASVFTKDGVTIGTGKFTSLQSNTLAVIDMSGVDIFRAQSSQVTVNKPIVFNKNIYSNMTIDGRQVGVTQFTILRAAGTNLCAFNIGTSDIVFGTAADDVTFDNYGQLRIGGGGTGYADHWTVSKGATNMITLNSTGNADLTIQNVATMSCSAALTINGTDSATKLLVTSPIGGAHNVFLVDTQLDVVVVSGQDAIAATPTNTSDRGKFCIYDELGVAQFRVSTDSTDVDSTNNYVSTRHLMPFKNLTYDMGTAALRYRTVFCQTANQSSDARLKQDVTEISNGLDAIMALRPVRFTWKGSEERSAGLIAQEVAAVIDKFHDQLVLGDDETEMMGISYTQLIPYLVRAVQELAKR